jgi:hypothetical protein
MHQKRRITCCIVTQFQIRSENVKILNFQFNNHQVILIIFPILLPLIWYIYPLPSYCFCQFQALWELSKRDWMGNGSGSCTKSRLRVKGLKVRDGEKIKEAMAISIQDGNYTNREIGVDIGKDLVQYRVTWHNL